MIYPPSSCFSHGTNIALYADDTKIWWQCHHIFFWHIYAYIDHDILQKDIDNLNDRAINSKIKFHSQESTVVSLYSLDSPLAIFGPPLEYSPTN